MAEESIQGLQYLLKKLDGLGSLVTSKNVIVRSLRAGAEPIRARAEQLAPDDPTTPGSRIKEGMMITVSDQTATGAVAKIGPARTAFFAKFHELGSSHQSARPFLRPAFDEKQDEALQLVGEELAEQIKKEMARR